MIQAMICASVPTSGAGMSLSGPMRIDDLGREAARERSSSLQRERLGVADDAALGAAEGQVDDGALPGHPHGERRDLVQRHVGVVADAALGRAARELCWTR